MIGHRVNEEELRPWIAVPIRLFAKEATNAIVAFETSECTKLTQATLALPTYLPVARQKSSRMACFPPKLITISAIELRTLGSEKF